MFDIIYCPYAVTSPRACGMIAHQPIYDAQGNIISYWHCTFCAEQEHANHTVRVAFMSQVCL